MVLVAARGTDPCQHVHVRPPQTQLHTLRCHRLTFPVEYVPFVGDEEPGCMTSGTAADGTFTVTGIGRTTLVCRAGPCLAFSPLYNPEGAHAH